MQRLITLGCAVALAGALVVNAQEAAETAVEQPVEQVTEPVTEQAAPPVVRVVEIAEPPPAYGSELYAIDEDGKNARPVARIKGYPMINSPEISPDGKWIAVDGWRQNENYQDGKLLFINLETWQARDLGYGCMQTWSADGRWFGVSKYGTHDTQRGVFVREFEGTQERLIDSRGWAIQWSPDGLKVAYTTGGNIMVQNLATNARHAVFPQGAPVYSYIDHNMTWSPDSMRICFQGHRATGGKEVAIVSASGGDPKLLVRCDGAPYLPDIAWHPDGNRIALPRGATAKEKGQIDVFNPNDMEPPQRFLGQPTDRQNQGLCWSRDGKTLYFISVK